MSLVALAFPELKQVDYNFIQTFRKQYDELYFNVVKPHFTVVFPSEKLSVEEYKEEMTAKLAGVNRFEFTIRCAILSKDSFSEYSHVFLVPDKGFSNLVKIHNRLYSGRLAEELRLDVNYIPHIGVGNSSDINKCKQLVDGLNKEYLCIRGKINSIDLAQYSENTVTLIERMKLR
jgi:hypothetical protein